MRRTLLDAVTNKKTIALSLAGPVSMSKYIWLDWLSKVYDYERYAFMCPTEVDLSRCLKFGIFGIWVESRFKNNNSDWVAKYPYSANILIEIFSLLPLFRGSPKKYTFPLLDKPICTRSIQLDSSRCSYHNLSISPN